MGLAVPVQLMGVNAIGQESGNFRIPAISDLPWLQDEPEQMVWESWKVSYRDVIILDERNVPVAKYNLSVYDLSVPTHYDYLKDLIVSFAEDGQ